MYFLINILKVIDAIDEKQSKFKEIVEGTMLGLTHPVLKNDKIAGLDIFRGKQSKTIIFISERIKKLIFLNEFSGMDFRLVKIL